MVDSPQRSSNHNHGRPPRHFAGVLRLRTSDDDDDDDDDDALLSLEHQLTRSMYYQLVFLIRTDLLHSTYLQCSSCV